MRSTKSSISDHRASVAAAMLLVIASIGCNESNATMANAAPASKKVQLPEITPPPMAPPREITPPRAAPPSKPAVPVNVPIRPESDRLPKLELQPLTRGTPSLDLSTLEGKVVLVNLWGTWCPPCREEFPHLAELRRKYQSNSEFVLVSVSCPPGESDLEELRRETNAFVSQHRYDGPVYADREYKTLKAFQAQFGRVAFPMTLIVDRRGIVVTKNWGFGPQLINQFEATINSLLLEKLPAPSKS